MEHFGHSLRLISHEWVAPHHRQSIRIALGAQVPASSTASALVELARSRCELHCDYDGPTGPTCVEPVVTTNDPLGFTTISSGSIAWILHHGETERYVERIEVVGSHKVIDGHSGELIRELTWAALGRPARGIPSLTVEDYLALATAQERSTVEGFPLVAKAISSAKRLDSACSSKQMTRDTTRVVSSTLAGYLQNRSASQGVSAAALVLGRYVDGLLAVHPHSEFAVFVMFGDRWLTRASRYALVSLVTSRPVVVSMGMKPGGVQTALSSVSRMGTVADAKQDDIIAIRNRSGADLARQVYFNFQSTASISGQPSRSRSVCNEQGEAPHSMGLRVQVHPQQTSVVLESPRCVLSAAEHDTLITALVAEP